MEWINHNGQLKRSDTPIFNAQNRAFRYGDGLFESIRVIKGDIPLLDRHWMRLKKSMQILQFNLPENFTPAFLKSEIDKLTAGKGHFRVRLTIYRHPGGFYTPSSDDPHFLIEAAPYSSEIFQLNEQGLSLTVYPEHQLACSPLANIKSTSAIFYVLAGRWLRQQKEEECLLLNQYGRVAECSIGNLLLIKGNQLITPSLNEGCIAGVMRSAVMDIATTTGWLVGEQKVELEDVMHADEVGYSNAIRGIQWIRQFRNQQYESKQLQELCTQLNQKYIWS